MSRSSIRFDSGSSIRADHKAAYRNHRDTTPTSPRFLLAVPGSWRPPTWLGNHVAVDSSTWPPTPARTLAAPTQSHHLTRAHRTLKACPPRFAERRRRREDQWAAPNPAATVLPDRAEQTAHNGKSRWDFVHSHDGRHGTQLCRSLVVSMSCCCSLRIPGRGQHRASSRASLAGRRDQLISPVEGREIRQAACQRSQPSRSPLVDHPHARRARRCHVREGVSHVLDSQGALNELAWLDLPRLDHVQHGRKA